MEYVYAYMLLGLLWMCLVKLVGGFPLRLKELPFWALVWPWFMWRAIRAIKEGATPATITDREGGDKDPPAAD